MFYPRHDCKRCGGGIENDHPELCGACAFELRTGLNFEQAADAAMKQRLTLGEYARKLGRL